MSETDNLQKADGKEEIKSPITNEDVVENESVKVEETAPAEAEVVVENEVENESEIVDNEAEVVEDEAQEDVINEIEESNAEDAEDEGNKERHFFGDKDIWKNFSSKHREISSDLPVVLNMSKRLSSFSFIAVEKLSVSRVFNSGSQT